MKVDCVNYAGIHRLCRYVLLRLRLQILFGILISPDDRFFELKSKHVAREIYIVNMWLTSFTHYSVPLLCIFLLQQGSCSEAIEVPRLCQSLS
jgi:hypothetical protein